MITNDPTAEGKTASEFVEIYESREEGKEGTFVTGFFDGASYGSHASVKVQSCRQYPDEVETEFCGWTTEAGDQGVGTFTISGERKMNFYPQLFAGEEYLVATQLYPVYSESPDDIV